MSEQQPKTIIDLLPYDASTQNLTPFLKIRVLEFIVFLCKEMMSAIEDFYIAQDYLRFDAHVGENLCQIRACQLIELAENTPENEQTKINETKKINQIKGKVRLILNLLSNYLARSFQEKKQDIVFCFEPHKTLVAFLTEHQLIFKISDTLYFLTISHFLTRFRTFNDHENSLIDYPLLTQELNASKNICRRLIHQYQKGLSKHSCDYVLKHKHLLKFKNLSLFHLLSHRDDDDRYTLPSYFVMDVLLRRLYMLKKNILIIVRCEYVQKKKLIPLFFSPDPKKYRFNFSPLPTEDDLKSPSLIIYGVVNRGSSILETDEDYIRAFNQYDLLSIVMANMAAHPQYSGKKLTGIQANPYLSILTAADKAAYEDVVQLTAKFDKLREFATDIGCTAEHPRLFFIRHILCGAPEQQFIFLQKGQFYSELLKKSGNSVL